MRTSSATHSLGMLKGQKHPNRYCYVVLAKCACSVGDSEWVMKGLVGGQKVISK